MNLTEKKSRSIVPSGFFFVPSDTSVVVDLAEGLLGPGAGVGGAGACGAGGLIDNACVAMLDASCFTEIKQAI